jgi:SlyX protein
MHGGSTDIYPRWILSPPKCIVAVSRLTKRNIGMTMPDDRLTALEIRAAEQEKTIEELSAEIAEQWKVIERLRAKVDALTDRFLSLEQQSAPDVPVTKPPHW